MKMLPINDVNRSAQSVMVNHTNYVLAGRDAARFTGAELFVSKSYLKDYFVKYAAQNVANTFNVRLDSPD